MNRAIQRTDKLGKYSIKSYIQIQLVTIHAYKDYNNNNNYNDTIIII